MATVTPAKAAKTVLNHPNFKMRLGDKYDKGDRLSMESLKQRLDPIVKAAEEKRIALEAGMFEKHMEKTYGIKKHDLGSFLTGAASFGLKSAKAFGNAKSKGKLFGAEAPDYKSRVPWLGAVSGVVGNLLMNKELDLPTYTPKDYNPEKATANLVDYSREREQIGTEKDIANNMIMSAARNSGSAAGAMENTLAGVTGTQRTAGELFNKSLENEGNINAGILNQTNQFNSELGMRANAINNQNALYKNQIDRENMMINSERRDTRIGGIMDSVTGYGRDLMAADQYDMMLKIATPDNYKMTNYNDSPLRRLLQITAPGKRELTNTDTLSHSLGGYVIPKSKKVPISFRTK